MYNQIIFKAKKYDLEQVAHLLGFFFFILIQDK